MSSILVPNWRQVLAKAYSTRLMVLAGGLEIAMQTMPYVADLLPWWVPVVVIAAGIGGRIIRQGNLDKVEDDDDAPLGI